MDEQYLSSVSLLQHSPMAALRCTESISFITILVESQTNADLKGE